ncbi:MAG: glycosyltransferase family 10 [Candidatus Absconditabacteria bacterium]
MIKVWYTDFWGGWDPYNNCFSDIFLKGIDYVIDPDPDILVYSCFGNKHERYSCKKIYWTGENTRPDLKADLALGFDYLEEDNYIRVPLYAISYWTALNEMKLGEKLETFLLRKKEPPKHSKFCAFVYANAHLGTNAWGNYQDGVEKRVRMFHKISEKKKVDSIGTALNNTGITVSGISKLNAIKDYKFTFAIENSSYPGYVTEKIIEPMMMHSVPIYWGSREIKKDFQGGYLNLHEMDEDDAIEYMLELDAKPQLYEELYYQNFLDRMSKYFDYSIIENRINSLF